jgi:hypothetical protein
LFIFLFFVLRWFIISFYENNFFPFKPVFIDIIRNTFYSAVLYLVYKKARKNA